MKPRFILNSFTQQLYSEDDNNKKIIPLIEPNLDQLIGYDPNYKGYSNYDDEKDRQKNGGDKDYWSLRHHNSIEKIQRMKDIKIYNEIKSVKDKPEINGKSKKMIDKEYKAVGVLKRMKMMKNKTIEKTQTKIRDEEYKTKKAKDKIAKSNSNHQNGTVQSKYLNNMRQEHNNNNSNKHIAKKNCAISGANANEDDQNIAIKREEDTRKDDLNKLITFMNQLI